MRVLARLGKGLQPIGTGARLRDARRLVRERGLRLDGDGRPQFEEVPGGDALVVRCRRR